MDGHVYRFPVSGDADDLARAEGSQQKDTWKYGNRETEAATIIADAIAERCTKELSAVTLLQMIDQSIHRMIGWNVGILHDPYEFIDAIIVSDAANLLLALKETIEHDVILSVRVSCPGSSESIIEAAAQVLGPRSAMKIQSGFNTMESYQALFADGDC